MTSVRVRSAGDAAVLVQFEAVISPDVNAQAIALARRVQEAGLAGVRDVVPAYRSVAVHLDPFVTDPERARALIQPLVDAAVRTPPPDPSETIEIPVRYGGDDGPDLEAVAAHAGVSPEEVIARHLAREYRVYMLGFLPGFPYLGSVDPSIAVPRRDTPRVRVPAGSVGIAGEQTGVYPLDSPGGWQIIGGTRQRMFDITREPPALCRPGDRVRFVRDDRSALPGPATDPAPRPVTAPGAPPVGPAGADAEAPVVATVLRPGLFTTVQDEGRRGYQHLGVPVAGAMDPLAHLEANTRAGNRPDAATIEATIIGPELRFERACTMAIAGADLSATIDGRPFPVGTAVACAAGSLLRFGARRTGARTYIAVQGGWHTPSVLGSRATHVRSGMGGLAGRPLRAGDLLAAGTHHPAPAGGSASQATAARIAAGRSVAPSPVTLRVLPGPHDDWFPPDSLQQLTASAFTVDPQSDRMGFRLAGGPALPRRAGEMISDATFAGGLQVPPSGDPILLMADRQTTGGYPILAVVITADLPAAGQLVPGDQIRFQITTAAEARAALAEMPRWS